MAVWREWKNALAVISHFGAGIKYFYGGFIAFALVMVLGFCLEQMAENRMLKKILEIRLNFVASMLPELLGEDFQDRYLLLREVSLEEYRENAKKIKKLIQLSGVESLKTLLKIDETFYYTAHGDVAAEAQAANFKLQAYSEAPQAYSSVLSTGKTQYGYDEHGKYEIIATMFSPKGQSYLVVASIDPKKIVALVSWQRAIRVSSAFILLLFVLGMYYIGTRSMAACVKQVEALSQTKASFEHKAQRDDLTTLLRRDTFFAMLYENLKFKSSEHQGYALLMLDIDNFKRINDIYGHMFGDEVIKLLARLCLRGRAKADLVGRYGGEEFIIFLDNLNKNSAITAAERIRKWTEEASLRNNEGEKVSFTVTIGGLWFKDAPVIVADYIYLADLQLLRGKKEGKNRVVVVEP